LAHALYVSAKETVECEQANNDEETFTSLPNFCDLYERLRPTGDDDNAEEDAKMEEYMKRIDVCALAYRQFYELTTVVLKANNPFGYDIAPNLAQVLSTPLQLVSMVTNGHDKGRLASKLFQAVEGLEQMAFQVAPFIFSAVAFLDWADDVYGAIVAAFLCNHKWHWTVAPIGPNEFTPVLFDVLPLASAHRLRLPDLRSDMIGRISFGEIILTSSSGKRCMSTIPGRNILPLATIHKVLPATVLRHHGLTDVAKWYMSVYTYFGEQTLLMSDATLTSMGQDDQGESMLVTRTIVQSKFGGSWIGLLNDVVHHCVELSDVPMEFRWDMMSLFLMESIGPPHLARFIESACASLPAEPVAVRLPKFEEDARVALAAAFAKISLSSSTKTMQARQQSAKLAKAAALSKSAAARFKPLTAQEEGAISLVLLTNIIGNMANLYAKDEVELHVTSTLKSNPALLQRLAVHKDRLLSAMFLFPDTRSAVEFACKHECPDNRLLDMIKTLERLFKLLFDMDILTAVVPVDAKPLPDDASLLEMIGTFTCTDASRMNEVVAYLLAANGEVPTVREEWRKHLTPQVESALSAAAAK
jgi:hypothetical protein